MSEQQPNPSNGDLSEAPAPVLKVKKLDPSAVLPARASPLSPGYDIFSPTDLTIPPRDKAEIKTELAIAVPDGTYGRIAPRTGLAKKHGVQVGAGVIDPDFRGNVPVMLYNHSDQAFVVNKGGPIAQLILEKIVTPEPEEVNDLKTSAIVEELPLLTGTVTIRLSVLKEGMAKPADKPAGKPAPALKKA